MARTEPFPAILLLGFLKGLAVRGLGRKEPLKQTHMSVSTTPHGVSLFRGVLPAQLRVGISCGHWERKQQHQLCLLDGGRPHLEKSFGFKSKLPLELFGDY